MRKRRKKKRKKKIQSAMSMWWQLAALGLFKSCISSIFPFSFCTGRISFFRPKCPVLSNTPVLSGIGWNLERYILKVFRYRFIDQYEKFQPYRLVQYGINFLATYTCVWFFLPWTFKSRINTTYTYVWFFLLWTFKSKINTTYTCRYNRISAGGRKERVE